MTHGGRATPMRPPWRASDVAAGPGGVFQISPGGHVERYAGGSFVRIDAKDVFDRVLAVGLNRLVVADARGRIQAVDARAGGATLLPVRTTGMDGRAGGASDFSIDPLTDDLLWIDAKGFWRSRAGEAEARPIR